jgi:cytoskeletal protein CcmA (bactofilin family)
MALFGKKENEERPPVVQPPAAPKSIPKKPAPAPTPAPAPVSTQDTTYFGRNLKITGNISGEGSSVILGSFEGDFDLKGQLKVAQGARIKGNVKATDIYVNGNVEGTIEASKKIHLENTARVKGRLITPKISILEGSVFDGEIQMSGQSAQPSKAAASGLMQNAPAPAASEKK